jgi:hypothetical protein
MAGTPAPFVKAMWFDNNGDPGYQLFTYSPGTTNKLATYSDAALTIANTNPIILDASGRADVFLSATTYKFVLAPPTDTDPPTVPLWTVDNVASVPSFTVDLDLTGTAGETLAAGEAVYLSAGDGGRTAGRWYLTSATNSYSSSSASALGMVPTGIASGAGGTIRVIGRVTGLSGLTTGSVYYLDTTPGALTLSKPANARKLAMADSTTSAILSQWLPPGSIFEETPTYKPPAGTPYIPVSGRLDSQYATVGNVGAGEDDLMAFTVLAGMMDTEGQSIRVIAWGKTANNANAKTLKAYFGATQVLGGSGAVLTVSEAGNWACGFQVLRDSATTQRAVAQAVCGPAGTQSSVCVGAVTAPGETLANSVEIKFTGTATADNDITQHGMVVTLVP